jgi:hypothetical protein
MLIKYVFFCFLFLFTVKAVADPLKVCQEGSAAVNATLPLQVNQYSVLRTSKCGIIDGSVIFMFTVVTDILSSQAQINASRYYVVNGLCTNPMLREKLNIMNMSYTYYKSSGVYIGEMVVTSRDCSVAQ